MIRPRSFSLGIERQVVCIRTTGFHGFTADGGLHTSRAPASSVATRRRWVEPQGRLSDPWGFAFRSSTGLARVEVVNFSPICTPTYGVARCLRVRNRCLELGGSGVGSRTSTSSSQLLARCGPLRRFHHSGESLLARVPARTWHITGRSRIYRQRGVPDATTPSFRTSEPQPPRHCHGWS